MCVCVFARARACVFLLQHANLTRTIHFSGVVQSPFYRPGMKTAKTIISSITVTAPADYTSIMVSFADVETFMCSWTMTVQLEGGRIHDLKAEYCSLTPRPRRYDSRCLHVKYSGDVTFYSGDLFSGLRMIYSFHKVCVF